MNSILHDLQIEIKEILRALSSATFRAAFAKQGFT
jgi:hypothetical protein